MTISGIAQVIHFIFCNSYRVSRTAFSGATDFRARGEHPLVLFCYLASQSYYRSAILSKDSSTYFAAEVYFLWAKKYIFSAKEVYLLWAKKYIFFGRRSISSLPKKYIFSGRRSISSLAEEVYLLWPKKYISCENKVVRPPLTGLTFKQRTFE